MKKKILALLILTISTFSLAACNNNEVELIPYTETRFFFDTLITITIYEDNQDALDKAIELCEFYQEKLSGSRDGSELLVINSSYNNPVEISDETIYLLEICQKFSEETEGLYDITIKPLATLWSVGDESPLVPTNDEINDTLDFVGYNNITIDGNFVSLNNEGTQIDLGSIAKGYIADELKELLINEGIDNAIINLGGNVHTIGNKPDGSAFEIGVQKPFSPNTDSITTIEIENQAVVTAGIYQRYFEQDDVIYHHLLDPYTGFPVENNLYSVTIISDSAMYADIYSTICMLFGLEEGLEFIESKDNAEAIFITNDLELIYTSGL